MHMTTFVLWPIDSVVQPPAIASSCRSCLHVSPSITEGQPKTLHRHQVCVTDMAL